MQHPQKYDVFGLSVQGDGHRTNHDHFAIATLDESMRLHRTNLTIDDESRVHGDHQGHLFLVADGISDGPAAARARSSAVDSVVHCFLNEMPWPHLVESDPADVTMALDGALENAQDELLRSAGDDVDAGTTMTLAFVFWPNLYLAHVGDSRCYLSRARSLRQLTSDHDAVDSTSARGPRSLRSQVRHLALDPGDVLALVTDGVTREESWRDIEDLLARDVTAEEMCGQLVLGSGEDDRTAIVVMRRHPSDVGRGKRRFRDKRRIRAVK